MQPDAQSDGSSDSTQMYHTSGADSEDNDDIQAQEPVDSSSTSDEEATTKRSVLSDDDESKKEKHCILCKKHQFIMYDISTEKLCLGCGVDCLEKLLIVPEKLQSFYETLRHNLDSAFTAPDDMEGVAMNSFLILPQGNVGSLQTPDEAASLDGMESTSDYTQSKPVVEIKLDISMKLFEYCFMEPRSMAIYESIRKHCSSEFKEDQFGWELFIDILESSTYSSMNMNLRVAYNLVCKVILMCGTDTVKNTMQIGKVNALKQELELKLGIPDNREITTTRIQNPFAEMIDDAETTDDGIDEVTLEMFQMIHSIKDEESPSDVAYAYWLTQISNLMEVCMQQDSAELHVHFDVLLRTYLYSLKRTEHHTLHLMTVSVCQYLAFIHDTYVLHTSHLKQLEPLNVAADLMSKELLALFRQTTNKKLADYKGNCLLKFIADYDDLIRTDLMSLSSVPVLEWQKTSEFGPPAAKTIDFILYGFLKFDTYFAESDESRSVHEFLKSSNPKRVRRGFINFLGALCEQFDLLSSARRIDYEFDVRLFLKASSHIFDILLNHVYTTRSEYRESVLAIGSVGFRAMSILVDILLCYHKKSTKYANLMLEIHEYDGFLTMFNDINERMTLFRTLPMANKDLKFIQFEMITKSLIIKYRLNRFLLQKSITLDVSQILVLLDVLKNYLKQDVHYSLKKDFMGFTGCQQIFTNLSSLYLLQSEYSRGWFQLIVKDKLPQIEEKIMMKPSISLPTKLYFDDYFDYDDTLFATSNFEMTLMINNFFKQQKEAVDRAFESLTQRLVDGKCSHFGCEATKTLKQCASCSKYYCVKKKHFAKHKTSCGRK